MSSFDRRIYFLPKSLKEELRAIAALYGVHCHFNPRTERTWAKAAVSRIQVGTAFPFSKRTVISSFFHELAHVVNYRENKYRSYNSGKASIKLIRRIGLRAELHADLVAKKLMARHFPGVRYYGVYRFKWAREWFYSFVERGFCYRPGRTDFISKKTQ